MLCRCHHPFFHWWSIHIAFAVMANTSKKIENKAFLLCFNDTPKYWNAGKPHNALLASSTWALVTM